MNNLDLFAGTTDSNSVLGAIALFVISLLILLVYEVRVMMIKVPKEKYDFVNLNEIRNFWYAVLAFIASLALYLNKLGEPIFDIEPSLKIYIRIFFLVAFVVITYLILSGMVRILYPRVIERRLNRIRNTPRISPMGNTMRKLEEHEEAVHLDQTQVEEQASGIHAVEYDVWLDEKTGYKSVEKYMASQHAEKCKECGFYTMKIDREEITKKPTATEEGLLVKHYRCSYCKHREAREINIAKLSTNS